MSPNRHFHCLWVSRVYIKLSRARRIRYSPSGCNLLLVSAPEPNSEFITKRQSTFYCGKVLGWQESSLNLWLFVTQTMNEISISEYIDFAVILKLQSRLECVEEI